MRHIITYQVVVSEAFDSISIIVAEIPSASDNESNVKPIKTQRSIKVQGFLTLKTRLEGAIAQAVSELFQKKKKRDGKI